jgi:CHAT domain-containing protein
MRYLTSLSLSLILPLFVMGQDYQQYLDLSYTAIDSITISYYQKGAFDKAIPYFVAAREKAKNEFGQQDSTYASYTNGLGFFYLKMGQYNKALALYTQAKNIREKVLGTEHPDFATSLNNLASLYERMGEYQRALPLYLQTIEIDQKTLGAEHPNFAISLNNLALLYEKMGEYEKALPLYLQSKNIREKALGAEHPAFANALLNLAGLYKKIGEYEKALPLYLQAVEINKKALGVEHPRFAQFLNNLALLYEKMGEYEKALPLYLQSKNIREKALGTEHPLFAESLNNLAILYKSMKKYEKALPLYLETIEINKKVLGAEHPNFATTLNNLAALYEKMGEYEKALPLYLQAKNIREKNLGKEHPDFAASLNNLAALYKSMGEYEKAWPLIDLVIASQSTLAPKPRFSEDWINQLKQAAYPSNEHLNMIVQSFKIAYRLLAKDSRISNRTTKQAILADVATVLLSKMRNQFSDDQDKLRMLALSNDWLLKSLEVLDPKEDQHKAFNRSDQNKSVLLLQATKSEMAYRLGALPDSLAGQDRTQRKKRSQLQAKLAEKRPKVEKDSLRALLNEVNQDIDAFVRMVKKEYPKYHKLKYAQVDSKVEEIQALLDEKSILIEYVITDSSLHIFRVDEKELSWHKEAILANELRKKIENLHQSLSDYQQIGQDQKGNFKSYTSLAHWFYQKLLAPVLKEGDGIENLIIVADGELGHLPFESFLVAAAKGNSYKDLHYLLKDYTISYNYSATLWKENKETEKSKNNGQMLAMAARYDENLDANLLRSRPATTRQTREVLQPLPAARTEVEALQSFYKGYFAFDSLASERVLMREAREYAVIHLAMHGLLDEARPMLSSLALTEDGDSLYDNFLQAYEISKMELNADLVVLSACETGYGRFETGNGIASLARAFMYAGVPALVVSLWQVNDQSTSIIMQNFYKHLASGMTKSAALRQAKLDYIESVDNPIAAHPAFWSPFILIGDESPVQLQRKGAGNWLWWAVGGGALALAALGFGLVRRKQAA